MAELNFDLLRPQPTAGASFVSGMMEGQQDARAARTQDLQNQVSQISLQKLRRDQENIDQIVATARAHGGPKNSRAVAEAFLNSNNPEHWGLGTKILQHEDAKDAYAKYTAAENGVLPAAPATPNTLATAVAPDVSATTPNTLATAVAPNTAAEPAVTTAIPFVAPPVATPLAAPGAIPATQNTLTPTAPAAPNVNALTKEQQIKALTVKLNTLAAMQSELPQVKPQIDLLKAQIINLQKPPVYHNVDGQLVTINPDGTPNVVFGEPTQLPIVKAQAKLKTMPLDDPDRPALEALVNKDLVAQRQAAERIQQGWGQLNVAQRNAATNEARLALAKDAPKLGLTDQGDIDTVALAIANGKLPVSRVNSTTAPLFAKLLKANPNIDFTQLNIDQTKAMSTARTQGAGTLTTEQNDALYGPNGAITTGKLDPYKVNSRNAVTLANAYIAKPDTDMNKLAQTATMMRNAPVVSRAQTVEMVPELLANMAEAGKKVNFSHYKFIGEAQKFLKGQSNNPDFVNYMTQRNDLLLTLAGVMRGNGATDKAHQAEIEAASPTLDPKAFDAYVQGQMTALKPRLKNAQTITRSDNVVAPPTATPASAARPAGVGANWTLETDSKGNRAYVSPDRKSFKEVP